MNNQNLMLHIPANTASHCANGFTTIPRSASFWKNMNPITTPELRESNVNTLFSTQSLSVIFFQIFSGRRAIKSLKRTEFYGSEINFCVIYFPTCQVERCPYLLYWQISVFFCTNAQNFHNIYFGSSSNISSKFDSIRTF